MAGKHLCKNCHKRIKCFEMCKKLSNHLNITRMKPLTSRISGDLMDKTTASIAGNWLKQRQQDVLQERGKHVKRIITHFQGYGNNGILYYWIWQVSNQEGISNHDIATILGISPQRVSQILSIIRI